MRPPDAKITPLVSRKSSKRHISARDFRLPKPYRMPVASSARPAMPRQRVIVLSLSALLAAGLVAALALITYDNVTSPHPLAVATDRPAARALPAPRPAAPAVHRSFAVPAGPAGSAQPVAGALPAPPSEGAALPLPITMEQLPDDPDVDLIATILLLTPRRTDALPACAGAPADGCSATATPDP